MTTTVTKRARFEAAHRLAFDKGKCGNLHGHNYLVEVEASRYGGPTDRATRMVMDFRDLKAVLRDVLEAFDHRTLLDRADPLVAVLREAGQEVTLIDGPPTTENIARTIHGAIVSGMANRVGVEIVRVSVWETRDSAAHFRPASPDPKAA